MAYRPRKLPSDISFEDAEDEVLYTRAALAADPNAQDLLAETDDWLPLIDGTRAADRDARAASMNAQAKRAVAGGYLDFFSERFADELFLAVSKDRESFRWLTFFTKPVSVFLRQRLDKQVKATQGWLSITTDDVLEKHRPNLTQWSTEVDSSMIAQKEAAVKRGVAAQLRADMAEGLTKERDGLFELLSARARAKGLAREWPQAFYRVASSKALNKEDEQEDGAASPKGDKGDT